jgi:hypothetical protein
MLVLPEPLKTVTGISYSGPIIIFVTYLHFSLSQYIWLREFKGRSSHWCNKGPQQSFQINLLADFWIMELYNHLANESESGESDVDCGGERLRSSFKMLASTEFST